MGLAGVPGKIRPIKELDIKIHETKELVPGCFACERKVAAGDRITQWKFSVKVECHRAGLWKKSVLRFSVVGLLFKEWLQVACSVEHADDLDSA
jgi:hypothetical protein